MNLIVVSENHIYCDFKVRTIIQRRGSSEVRARSLLQSAWYMRLRPTRGLFIARRILRFLSGG